MECNRDEAVRSRCIAEQKFLQHDVVGARKFALKAQYLFPDLEGLPQLLAVLDVHIVAQQKVDGVDVNWYGILQTDASADDVTIRKQYRKMALILHPDKNKAIGAEAAFKLVSEAWRVLSDKEKKAAHDARRSCNGFDFSATKSAKGFRNFMHFSSSYQPKPSDSLKKSFWTGCPSCKMQFEFMRTYENRKISCPTCSVVFRATELQDAKSSSKAQSRDLSPQVTRSNIAQGETHKSGGTALGGSSFSFHWGPHKFNAANYANATAQMVQDTYEAVRRERIKAQKEAREKAAMSRMEADMEMMKREREERKQKRKEQLDKPVTIPEQNSEHNTPPEAKFASAHSAQFWRADSGASIPAEEVGSRNVHMSSLSACRRGKDSGSCPSGKTLRLDQLQESFRCRSRNGFDSANSYDSSDALAFSKRLKVDV